MMERKKVIFNGLKSHEKGLSMIVVRFESIDVLKLFEHSFQYKHSRKVAWDLD